MPGAGARHGERPSTLREIVIGAYHPQNLAHIGECQQQLEGYQLAVEFRNRTWFELKHTAAHYHNSVVKNRQKKTPPGRPGGV